MTFFNKILNILIKHYKENAFVTVICQTAAILPWPRSVILTTFNEILSTKDNLNTEFILPCLKYIQNKSRNIIVKVLLEV